MRLAVFSDVHGNWHALQAVLQDLRGRADVAVCAGDLAWGGPFPERTVEQVQAGGFPCVLGNTDVTAADEAAAAHHPWARWARARLEPRHLAFLQGLPREHRIETPAGTVLVVHSTPSDPAAPLPKPSEPEAVVRLFRGAGAALVVHGHDHLPSVTRAPEVWVVGTGSVGLPFDGDPRACYVLVTATPDGFAVEHRRVAYDVEAAAREALQGAMPGAARWAAAVRQGLSPDRVAP
ncbi:MAG TPA: metallophosphoesterase family protein [Limnochordales bacterium]